MEKRYQIFVSSTFTDLKKERQAVLTAILEVGHTPAGMELFPAGDDTAWQLIKDVIEASDYYVLIVGGRYGSLDETGLSFTEKEYDYAVAANKPVIPLLHRNPDNLPRNKTDIDAAAWEKLKSFRRKVEKRHTCDYWKTAGELKAKVIVGLTAAIKRHPAVGWIRADQTTSETKTEPTPVEEPKPKPTVSRGLSMREVFHKEFTGPGIMRFYNSGNPNLTFDSPMMSRPTIIEASLILDSEAQTYFMAFYVPHSWFTFKIIKDLADRYKFAENNLRNDFNLGIRIGTNTQPKPARMTEDAVFSRRIIIYHESDLNLSQKAEIERLYKKRNLHVQFRDMDYLFEKAARDYASTE